MLQISLLNNQAYACDQFVSLLLEFFKHKIIAEVSKTDVARI